MKSELDKLEAYLIEKGIPYARIDMDDTYDDRGRWLYMDRHQIIAYGDAQRKDRIWDAICHRGSYGYEEGKLEIMGRIVNKEDSMEGFLTAEEVIQRIEDWEAAHETA
jgi:hypothetical protein